MDIKFDDIYRDEYYNTITLYFTAPKEILKEYFSTDYPEATAAEISIEVPADHIEAKYALVSISPTKLIEGGQDDYDWRDIDMDPVLIETLFVEADI